MRANKLFDGRTLLIATKHEKNKVIAPVLERELGVKCEVAHKYDTDSLGTFTREVERENDPLTTARLKCQTAMKLYNCDLAIASEGSFGPHPNSFFLAADEEFLILIDSKNDLEIVVREVSTNTNFSAADIKTEAEIFEFAKKAKFPSHGVILRSAKNDYTDVTYSMNNRLQDTTELLIVMRRLMSTFGSVYVETDMRAMCNPTRMEVIGTAILKLIEKIKSECPNCGTPGFSITEIKKGLPCEWCGSPTNSTLSAIYTCKKCSFKKEELFPQKKQVEDPMFCDNCNP
jgi:hypothetical protein